MINHYLKQIKIYEAKLAAALEIGDLVLIARYELEILNYKGMLKHG